MYVFAQSQFHYQDVCTAAAVPGCYHSRVNYRHRSQLVQRLLNNPSVIGYFTLWMRDEAGNDAVALTRYTSTPVRVGDSEQNTHRGTGSGSSAAAEFMCLRVVIALWRPVELRPV